MTLQSVMTDFQEHLWVYLAIPLVAAFVGYITKTLAVEMIFRPIKFVGIEPWLGWQGILPRKAHKIATHAADLMAEQLLDSNELFERLDPERMLRELERPVNDAAEALVREIGDTYLAGFWGRLPAFAQRKLVERVQAEIPGVKKEDISVTVHDGVLTVSGERKREQENQRAEGEGFHIRAERRGHL